MSNQSHRTNYVGLALAAGILIAMIVGIVIYVQKPRSDMSYTDTTMPTDGNSPMSNGMGGEGPGPSSQANQMQGIGGRMVVGKVIDATASTLTVETTEGSRTFTITDDTEILPGANQAARSYDPASIEIGSTVAIELDSSNSDQANAIALNYQTKTNEQ